MASATIEPPAIRRRVKRLTFFDLPLETQNAIIAYCAQCDLICVSLVSRHFRELAAKQLYRNFHIVFPDEDDPSFDSPIDGLAGGLDTFVTSDYDYARHLKDLSLDTLSAGEKAENAYKPYLYNASCGKFMNTLLLLTLRKASSLERFKWNIRVELSRPVYKALHQISTLSHLHLRMQAGPSLHETPPPLPYASNALSGGSLGHWSDLMPPMPQSSQWLPPVASTLAYPLPPNLSHHPAAPKSLAKAKTARRAAPSKDPPTLSGFKNLQTLSVLDIDSLDMVTEIKTCVRNSASTLTKLKLSFSDALASQARKPPPEADSEDSDVDEEFQVVPVSQNSGFPDDASGPAKAFRAQEEKKNQEAVLGRIFDVEPFIIKQAAPRKSLKGKEKEMTLEPAIASDDKVVDEKFVNAVKEMYDLVRSRTNEDGDFSPSQQDVMDSFVMAVKALALAEQAKKLVEDGEERTETATGESNATSSGTLVASSAPEVETAAPANNHGRTILLGGNNSQAKDGQAELEPEDIDIEQPVETEDAEDAAPQDGKPTSIDLATKEDDSNSNSSTSQAKMTPASSSSSPSLGIGKAIANLTAQKVNFEMLVSKLSEYQNHADELCREIQSLRDSDGNPDPERIKDAEKQLQGFSRNIKDIQREISTVEAEIDDAERQIPSSLVEDEADSRRAISDYVRATRGLALQSLCIYLVPVKASVLSRAVDLSVLKRLTLLNVGAQAPIWTLLSKENKIRPLSLRKIFTDNVSPAFLTCVSQLPELHELFVLERSAKYKPESFAPKTTVKMDQIRRLVLRKHMHTLRKLMIKHESTGNDSQWDVDEKTMMLICNRGGRLEELAVSMGIRAVHTFLQHLSGLANLRALNIIHFRNEDTCVWVIRETRRFIIDNLSHYPHLKLEWISVDDDRAVRILRASDLPKKADAAGRERRKKEKKTKAALAMISLGISTAATAATQGTSGEAGESSSSAQVLDMWDSESESEDETDGLNPNLKLEMIEHVHFYDVWGVRIFKKEVLAGRL